MFEVPIYFFLNVVCELILDNKEWSLLNCFRINVSFVIKSKHKLNKK